MLRNQLASLPSADTDRAAALTAEIEAMERDPERWPWQDGLPADIARGFEPYRERLEASYDAPMNALELMRAEKTGSFQYQVK
jgi:hypothetical protein